jgi:sugar (pentulose or hexulose) kinase
MLVRCAAAPYRKGKWLADPSGSVSPVTADPVLLAIDKGTSEIKVLAYTPGGEMVAEAHQPSASTTSEEDLADVWLTTVRLLREVGDDLKSCGKEPVGIGVSGHMGGLILLDDHEEPLGPAILWTDERAKPLISEWDRSGMTSALFDQSGTALITGLTLPLWAWMSIHQPEIVSPTRHVLFMKDWIRWKLTEVLATDESEHMWIPGDVRKRALTEEVLDTVGAQGLLERLPPIVDATAVVGGLTHEVSQATGLPKGLPVVAGAGDAVAAAVGMGALYPGDAFSVLGTSFLNNVVTKEPLFEPRGIGFNFLTVTGYWLRLLANTGGGSLNLRWLRERVSQPFATLDAWVQETPPGANGVLYLPYVTGTGVTAPFYNLAARATFVGITARHGFQDLARAVYEGLGLAMKDCYEALPVPLGTVRLGGGSSRNPVLCQIAANCTNRSIEVPKIVEGTNLGVALMAGVGSGVFPDLDSAVRSTVQIAARYEPQAEAASFYQEWYRVYVAAREGLMDTWRLAEDVLRARQSGSDG